MSAIEERLNLEILKLLIQVAWADDEVAASEIDYLRQHAQEAGLGPAAVALLDSYVNLDKKLPAPDFGFLRAHRDQALAAAEKMVRTDDRVAAREEDTLAQIRQLLGD